MSKLYTYDEDTDEFELGERENGNTVVVSEPNIDGLVRYDVAVDDYGYVIGALVRLFNRLGLNTRFE